MQANGLPIVSGGIDVASARSLEIASLRRRIIEQDTTIARQVEQLAQYAKMLDAERAAGAQIGELLPGQRTHDLGDRLHCRCNAGDR